MELKMKYTIYALATAALLNMASVSAEEIAKPTTVLNEGLETTLTEEQIESILPWANNSKVFIEDLFAMVKVSTFEEALNELRNGYTDVVLSSAPDNAQVLLRFSLNRGLEYTKILKREVEENSVGLVDTQTRILKVAGQLALNHFASDLLLLEKKTDNLVDLKFKYAIYGLDFAGKMLHVAKSVIDASAQHAIFLTTLKFLQVDLYRDLDRNRFAVEIRKIQNLLKTVDREAKKTDFELLEEVRQMKALVKALKISNLLQSLQNEKVALLEQVAQQRLQNQQNQEKEEAKKKKAVFAKYIQSLTNKNYRSPKRELSRGDEIFHTQKIDQIESGVYVQGIGEKESLILVDGSPKKVEKRFVSHKNICTLGFCTGDKVFFVRSERYNYRNYYYVTEGVIIGGTFEDDILIEYQSKEKKQYAYAGFNDKRYYAVGCSSNVCVDDNVYVMNKDYKSAKIVGHDGEGTLVLEVTDGKGTKSLAEATNDDVIKL